MVPEETTNSFREKVREIESRFGLLPGGNDLVRALGFRSSAALRAAANRGRGIVRGVPVFRVPGQERGLCTSAKALATLIIEVESLCTEAMDRKRKEFKDRDNSKNVKDQLNEVVQKMNKNKLGNKWA